MRKTHYQNEIASSVYSVETDEDIMARIISIAEREYPYECCGILIGRCDDHCFEISDVYETCNHESSVKRADSFTIGPMDVYKCERALTGTESEIIGFYHSHPDRPAVLSVKDENGMLPGLLYVLISVSAGMCKDITAYIRLNEMIHEATMYNENRQKG